MPGGMALALACPHLPAVHRVTTDWGGIYRLFPCRRLDPKARLGRLVRGGSPALLCPAPRRGAHAASRTPPAPSRSTSTPLHLSRLCTQLGSTLIYISTDVHRPPWTGPLLLHRPHRPTNFYGEKKLAGKRAVLAEPSGVVFFGFIISAFDRYRSWQRPAGGTARARSLRRGRGE